MGSSGSKPNKEIALELYAECHGDIFKIEDALNRKDYEQLNKIEIYSSLFDNLLEIHDFQGIKVLFDVATQFISNYLNKNELKYLYDIYCIRSANINEVKNLYTKFYQCPVLSPEEIKNSFGLILRIKKEGCDVKDLINGLSFLFSHSLIQLSNELNNSVTLDKFEYKKIPTKYPNGIYKGGDNKFYIVTNEIRKLDVFITYINREELHFLKNLYYFECDSNNVYY